MRSDAELLAAAATDPGKFRELYERYAAGIYGYPPEPLARPRGCARPDGGDLRPGLAQPKEVP